MPQVYGQKLQSPKPLGLYHLSLMEYSSSIQQLRNERELELDIDRQIASLKTHHSPDSIETLYYLE